MTPPEEARGPEPSPPGEPGSSATSLIFSGFTSFRWDVLGGTISTDPMGSEGTASSRPRTSRPEHELLGELTPADAESVRRRAQAAQSTGQALDVQVWVPLVGGRPRLFWMHGTRQPVADSSAPLIGALVDVTNLANSLAVAAAHGLPDHGDPARVGRFAWDESTRIVQLSPEAAEIVGVERGGAHPQSRFRDVIRSEDYATARRTVRTASIGDVLDLVVRRGDDDAEGRLHLRAIVNKGDGGGIALLGTVQDVEDEAVAHQAVVNVSRALKTLSHGTHVLNTATSEQGLLDDICTTIVRDGGYHFAWYGRAIRDDTKTVHPVAWAGFDAGYLTETHFSWSADDPSGQGPTGVAIRTGEVQYAHLMASHPAMDPWREAAMARGYVSSASLPVVVDGVVDGALMVYATEATAFDPLEIKLLSDLARDIGWGLRRLADVRSLEETTRAAEANIERLQSTLDSLLDPFVLLEAVRDGSGHLVDLRYCEANEAAAAYNGMPREELLGKTLLELLPGHVDDGPFGLYRATVETGRPLILDDFLYFNEILGEARRTDTRAVRCRDGIALTWRDVTERYEARQDISRSERRYRLLAENSSDVVLLTDLDMLFTWVSPSITQTTGWDPADLVGSPQRDYIHPEDLDRLDAEFAANSEAGLESDFRFRCASGAYRWMSGVARWATDDGGIVVGLVVGLRDIDKQVQTQHELAEREDRYRLLSDNASDVVLQVGSDGRISWASESITSVLGWPGRDILGRVATELVHPEDREGAVDRLQSVLGGTPTHGQMRVLRVDGTPQWMAVTVHRVQTGADVFRIVALRDIQEAVRAQVELEHAIGHDPLTGLSTRSATQTRLRHLLERLPTSDRSIAVLCVGIDALKTVNEALSHEAGDHVIAVVAARISSAVGDDDLVGRGTGDEFLVLLPELANGADAALIADTVRLAAHGVISISSHRIEPTVSIGIATGDRRADAEDLLRDASLAMHQAKRRGRDCAEFVDPHLATEARRRLLVDGAVREAVRDGELVPWFQPIVTLADGALTGYEALVRWVKPDGATVEPAAFLPVAERTSLITELDLTILERSIARLSLLPAPLSVAVNVSAATLARPDYPDRVLRHLADSGVDPTRLHLEVTETAVLRITEQVRLAMYRLADVGIRWYMDDFGTGYSSITHLRDLPIAGMKLDRSFTGGLGTGETTSKRLAQALGGLARGLGLDTVAEGVETTEEAGVVASCGWVHGQGWLYGKAAPLG